MFTQRLFLLIVLSALTIIVAVARPGELSERFQRDADRMLTWTRADRGLFPLLADFTDHYPARLSGSENLERGLDWIVARMKADGWTVTEQPVMVPNWKRGKESLEMTSPVRKSMNFCGLGGSVGTNGKSLSASVLVVKSMDELRQRSAEVKGRIVVYNVPFTTYGQTVAYRYNGASEAARYGAVASLVRSVGPYGIQTVHTGGMAYNDSLPKIPTGAITIEDALLLQRMQDRGELPQLSLSMEARWEKDARSRNIVVELRGTERPNDVVVMGGHIDSWDLGTGAMDDAGGCFVAWRALHMIRELGLRPKRTIRVCFWTNEENGLRGGTEYARATAGENHVLAIESDAGVFAPTGFTCSDSGGVRSKIVDIAQLLKPVHAASIEHGEGGADIGPLHQKGVPVMELTVQGDRYFWYHHTDGDTIDKLEEHEVNDCVYAMAVMAWCYANH